MSMKEKEFNNMETEVANTTKPKIDYVAMADRIKSEETVKFIFDLDKIKAILSDLGLQFTYENYKNGIGGKIVLLVPRDNNFVHIDFSCKYIMLSTRNSPNVAIPDFEWIHIEKRALLRYKDIRHHITECHATYTYKSVDDQGLLEKLKEIMFYINKGHLSFIKETDPKRVTPKYDRKHGFVHRLKSIAPKAKEQPKDEKKAAPKKQVALKVKDARKK